MPEPTAAADATMRTESEIREAIELMKREQTRFSSPKIKRIFEAAIIHIEAWRWVLGEPSATGKLLKGLKDMEPPPGTPGK